MRIGLDFGTTNSGAAVFDGQRVRVFPLDPASRDPGVVRSTLYITREHKVSIGQEAVDAYYRENVGRPSKMVRQYLGEIELTFGVVESVKGYPGGPATIVRDVYALVDELTPGRLLRSLKSVLASGYEGTTIFDRTYRLEELVAIYLREIGERVEAETGPTITFERDECIRPGTTPEKLAKLGPVKGIQSYGDRELVITAGNSCPTNDGISAALLMSEEKALALGLEPLARVVGLGVGGVKPQLMGIGPIVSTRKALAHAGIESEQIDRVEFNEAFAAQVLPSVRDLGIPLDRVNVNGGSIAIGHPLGATGARLVTTVAKELRRSGTRYGLATQCIGAGMGISTILERVD